jgi:hypothetical protein
MNPTKLTGRGGPGRGQGRKPAAADALLKVHALRLSDPDWKEFELLGGIKWLRAVLAASRGARPAATLANTAALRAALIAKIQELEVE